MRVAVCDDSAQDQALVIRSIHECALQSGVPIQVTPFRTGTDFLRWGDAFDVVFMDIHLPDMTGIQAIQSCPHPGAFIFVTASADYALKAFEMNAADYLLKPVADPQVCRSLRKCMIQLRIAPPQIINIRVCSGFIPVPVQNIKYIEVFNKISVIHTENNAIETFMSLGKLHQMLDPHVFLRVHRSFVVNMHEIMSMNHSAAVLRSGRMIAISRQNRERMLSQYQDFLLENACRSFRGC